LLGAPDDDLRRLLASWTRISAPARRHLVSLVCEL
jgi:hypothetical protein